MRRPQFRIIRQRLGEPRRFLQVLTGPRQVGKTTLAHQVLEDLPGPGLYASADGPLLEETAWIESQWEKGRRAARQAGGAILILDEVQKIGSWFEVVKRLWDEDTAAELDLRVMILDSSALLLQRGLSESLAGRFEVIRTPHWRLPEMREAFGWGLAEFLHFGGYPGSAPLIEDESRWARYILDSLIETVLGRDILLMARVDKPALLRRLLELACSYSGQILSYQKMLGQLQEAGNTTTLAHYLDLLAGAGLAMGLSKYSGSQVRRRAASPKLLVLNTALITAPLGRSRSECEEDPELQGRIVESAVGAHLAGQVWEDGGELLYWCERSREVDFLIQRADRLLAIEVASGCRKASLPGLAAFERLHGPSRRLLVGAQGIPVVEFLDSRINDWLE